MSSEISLEETASQVEKLRYQVMNLSDLIAKCCDEKYPIELAVVDFNWGDEDHRTANDIFEKFDKILQTGDRVNWVEFESDFSRQLSIGYQSLKMIILSFHANHFWVDVCKAYAKHHDVAEFKEINKG